MMPTHEECKEMLQRLSDYLDGELALDLREALEKHLCECGNCRVVFNTLQKTIELYRVDSEDIRVTEPARLSLYKRLHLP